MISRITVFCVCCFLALPALAEDELWEWVTPLPQGHNLFAVATGNGLTVAVGRYGTVITSTDGVEWRRWLSGADFTLYDVAFGNGIFVAVGGRTVSQDAPDSFGVVLTSSDGFNWVERYRISSVALLTVVLADTRFVAMGQGNRALLSSAGLVWEERDLGEMTGSVGEIAWNGSSFLGVGVDGSWPVYRGAYFTSENGEEWQQYFFEDGSIWSSIAAFDGRFVAVGREDFSLVSDDGMTWTEGPYGSSRNLDRIVAGGEGFLTIGWNVIGTSFDGYTWTFEDLFTGYRVRGLAWLGEIFLAVGADGFMMSSPEGSEWTPLSARSFEPWEDWWIDELATNGSTVVGFAEGEVIITGKHGTDWVLRTVPGDVNPVSVMWTGSAFWAAGHDGVIRSVDGAEWTQQLVDHDITLFDIAWNGSLYIAVGWNPSPDDGRKLVLTSPDGSDWSYQWFDQEDHFFTVGWTGSSLVAAGRGSHYLLSVDGENWEEHQWANEIELRDMASNGDRLVAVGGSSGVGGVVLSTVDGIQWEESALPGEDVTYFDDVTWTGTHFVAVSGADVIFTSSDGISWSSESTGTGVSSLSVVGDERSLFVIGPGLQIIRRTRALAGPETPRRPGRRVVPVGNKARVAPFIR